MGDPVKFRKVIETVSTVAKLSKIDNPAVLVGLLTVSISLAVRPATVNVCVDSELALTDVGLIVAE